MVGPDGKPSGSTDKLQFGVYFSVTIKECQQTWGTCYVGNEGRQQCAVGPNGQQDPEFDPDPDYSHCDWDEYNSHYLGGYTSLGPASFWTLDEAKEACETLSLLIVVVFAIPKLESNTNMSPDEVQFHNHHQIQMKQHISDQLF